MRKLTIMGLLLMMMQTLCVKAQITRGYFTVPSEGQFYLYSVDQNKFYKKSGSNGSQLTTSPEELVTLEKLDGYDTNEYSIKTGENYFKRGTWKSTFFWTDGTEGDEGTKWAIEAVDEGEYYTIASTTDGEDPYHINSSQNTYLNAWKSSDDAHQKIKFAFISEADYQRYVQAQQEADHTYQDIPAMLDHSSADVAGGTNSSTGWNNDHWGYMNNGSSVTYYINNTTQQDYTLTFDAQAKDGGSSVEIVVKDENLNVVVDKTINFNLWGWNSKCRYRVLLPNLQVGKYSIEQNYRVNSGYSANTFDLTISAGNTADLVLSETETTYDANGYYESVTIVRSLKSDKWNTFCIPFPMSKPEGWMVKTLTAASEEDGQISLTFSDANSIEAGKPYMVKCDAAYAGSFVKEARTVGNAGSTRYDDVVDFKGNYTSQYVPEGCYFISNNTFYRAADNSNTLKGFRAYLEPLIPAEVKGIAFVTEDGEETAIEEIDEEETPLLNCPTYDLNGRRVKAGNPLKGIYVVNGKKVIF